MTRSEVLALVRHYLEEAKRDVAGHKDSLMLGRTTTRCLGCDQEFASGVNGRLAAKVNHRALPPSGILTPAGGGSMRRDRAFPALRGSTASAGGWGRGRPGGLRPLQVAQSSSSHQRRGRPSTNPGVLRRPLMRLGSLEGRRTWRKRSR